MWALLQPIQEHAAEAAAGAAQEPLDVGQAILEHVANSPLEEPLIHLPKILGIDFSVTKHVFMLWVVATLIFVVITWIARRHLKKDGAPSGLGNLLEYFVEFVRDGIALPNFGKKWVNTWTPLVLTFFVFIFGANLIGMIPIFESLNILNHFVVHADHHSFFGKVIHGSTTATGNFNVTAALATITFFAIIIAGSKAHGFGKHVKNIVPHGLPLIIYAILIPIEILGLFVKPFALTMRLAANMTGGHIALMAVLSLAALFTQMFQSVIAGLAVGAMLSVPLAVGLSALELIVVLVQAYVFTLLSATFIGMAIHVHH
jgi:F-type H+-transporting ATPase subunit a